MSDAASKGNPLRRKLRTLLTFSSSLLGAALIGALGFMLAQTSMSVGTFGHREQNSYGWMLTALGESLARLSYDLPFIIRGVKRVPDACFVYLDEEAALDMEQTAAIWDRALHVQLLRHLTDDHARVVLFDIVFSDPWEEARVDEEFAEAIRKNGRVILAGALGTGNERAIDGGLNIFQQKVIPPTPSLRQAAAGWGTISFNPLDGDYAVRRMQAGEGTVQSAAWKAAKLLGANLPDSSEETGTVRWMNYYGPAGCFEKVAVNDILKGRVKPGHFRNRIVVIGGLSTLGGIGFGKDDFRNPYSVLGGAFSSGAEVHLTALLNLLHNDSLFRLGTEVPLPFLQKLLPEEWLTQVGLGCEPWFALGFGILLGGILPRFRPIGALLLSVGSALGVCLCAFWLFTQHQLWFAWSVPVFIQIPVALVWALGARYFIEERRRIALRNAFGHYLSPRIADRIADSEFDLAPGGKMVEASVLFTDLEGFTSLSEELRNPELVTSVLLKYFAQTTTPILDNDGMIINFVGDAVTAVWGVPYTEPGHARKAALAALGLRRSARIEIEGHLLRTRIGLHTGWVLAGNVGSTERFDYAVVGDPVNFASRLEGLNKFLGTDVLISDAVRIEIGDSFITRCLGEFRVSGKKDTCIVHELLDSSPQTPDAAWRESFENARRAFCAGNLDDAERGMRETLAIRGGSDGPSAFYLRQIACLKDSKLPENWSGIVQFTEK